MMKVMVRLVALAVALAVRAHNRDFDTNSVVGLIRISICITTSIRLTCAWLAVGLGEEEDARIRSD